jgi:hypothetical protein
MVSLARWSFEQISILTSDRFDKIKRVDTFLTQQKDRNELIMVSVSNDSGC